MKTRILLLLLITVFSASMKPEVLHIDEVYEDPANLLLRSAVVEAPGLGTQELREKVSKWTDAYLANTKELWVTEGDASTRISCLLPFEIETALAGQVTMYYYVIILIEYKEGKIRYKIYDDGNEYEPPTQNTDGEEARSYYYKDFFDKKGELAFKGIFGKVRYRMVSQFNFKVIDTEKDLTAHITGNKEDDDDW